ncbi:hypothetical protein GCM10022631_33740 [Deinococcus rubellus]|uniref:Alpha-D-phosphohexomutase C-terminal domain-containing protein n=1 Tax=Deinococcus rubellus TaxID=1889240 RepID=A0ABY5YKJ6_9DEIO|nr:hypothetical protein [Deinococcus rubellus]UWX65624.1 hypothetical protein N0D28_10265 [Deinococcus rubellus]
MIGGEESGGLSSRGHIPERDGLLNSLLLIEAVAMSGHSLGELSAGIEANVGFKHIYDQADLHLSADFDKVRLLGEAATYRDVAGYAVEGVNTRDGMKLDLVGGASAMFRASGTEPVLRGYVEVQSEADVRALLDGAIRRVRVLDA